MLLTSNFIYMLSKRKKKTHKAVSIQLKFGKIPKNFEFILGHDLAYIIYWVNNI